MKKPALVQRCEISEGKLQYDYMGSAEFEMGACPSSLKRIFAKGLTCTSTTVHVEGKEIKIHIIAGGDFSLPDYQPHLQQMAENGFRLKERTEFDDAIKQQLGIKLSSTRKIRNNGWFDIENDVFWTITDENQRHLLARLEYIKELWADKEAAKK